jgi:hypothetical protein
MTTTSTHVVAVLVVVEHRASRLKGRWSPTREKKEALWARKEKDMKERHDDDGRVHRGGTNESVVATTWSS